MDEREFESRATPALQAIERALEASGAELDFELKEGGVLEIEFEDGSKIIRATAPSCLPPFRSSFPSS